MENQCIAFAISRITMGLIPPFPIFLWISSRENVWHCLVKVGAESLRYCVVLQGWLNQVVARFPSAIRRSILQTSIVPRANGPWICLSGLRSLSGTDRRTKHCFWNVTGSTKQGARVDGTCGRQSVENSAPTAVVWWSAATSGIGAIFGTQSDAAPLG